MRRLRTRAGEGLRARGRSAAGGAADARDIQDQLVAWRRHFHENPEVGTETPETAAYVAGILTDLAFEVRTGVGGHGVVGVLRGGTAGAAGAGVTFAIRSDMDALNISEDTGLPFASNRPGKMHACGHDAHMAMALGAATVLSRIRESLPGNVKFIFQPAEEGPGGAKAMLEDGALEEPKVDAIVGLHIGCLWDVPSGSVGVMPGPMMAAMDRFEIVVKGKGGHAAMPHQAVDSVVVGSHVVTALQTVVSRKVSPLAPAVVTVGRFQAGTAHNIIAATAALEGTARCLNEDLRGKMPGYIEQVAKGVCQGLGADCDVTYYLGYPVVVNDPEFTAFFEGVAREVLGEDRVTRLSEPTMGGEDMAFYLQKVPGTFFFLGSTPSSGQIFPHHNPRFDIDEATLPVGATLLAETAKRWLADQAARLR